MASMVWMLSLARSKNICTTEGLRCLCTTEDSGSRSISAYTSDTRRPSALRAPRSGWMTVIQKYFHSMLFIPRLSANALKWATWRGAPGLASSKDFPANRSTSSQLRTVVSVGVCLAGLVSRLPPHEVAWLSLPVWCQAPVLQALSPPVVLAQLPLILPIIANRRPCLFQDCLSHLPEFKRHDEQPIALLKFRYFNPLESARDRVPKSRS